MRGFRYPSSTVSFVGEMLGKCRRNRSLYLPVFREMANNQESQVRRSFALIVGAPTFCEPLVWLMRIILKIVRLVVMPVLAVVILWSRVCLSLVSRLLHRGQRLIVVV